MAEARETRRLRAAGLALLLAGLPAGVAWAQVVTDGSLGPAGEVLPGTDRFGQPADFLISEDLGRQRGGNLFHSFDQFDVPPNHVATFEARNPPQPVENVISRVTGPTHSEIFGTIRSTIAEEVNGTVVAADLYLFNPQGILIGQGASLDVLGSFYASSAERLRFEDGSWDTTQPIAAPRAGRRRALRRTAIPDSLLSAASPSAFGFVGEQPSSEFVRVDRAELLEVPAGATFSAVGGRVQVFATEIRAPGGSIQIASAVGEVDIPVDLQDMDVSQVPDGSLGEVRVEPRPLNSALTDAELDVGGASEGDPAGTILIRSETFILGGLSTLTAVHQAATDAPPAIDVATTKATAIVGGQVLSSTTGSGRGGSISLSSAIITVADTALGSGQVVSQTEGRGAGGALDLTAESVTVRGGNSLVLTCVGPCGETGDFADAVPGEAQGGDLTINARTIEVIDGGQLLSITESSGDAGQLEIVGADSLRVSGESSGVRSAIVSRVKPSGTGNGGLVSIKARELVVEDGAFVSGDTTGPGDAGGVEILGAESITIARGGLLSAGAVPLEDSPPELGAAGDITIETGRLELLDGGQISPTAALKGEQGDSGAVTIAAETIVISGVDPDLPSVESGIFSQAIGASGGGEIRISATDRLTISDGGTISVSTRGAGAGGAIVVEKTGSLFLDEGGTIRAETFAGSTGDGGSIVVTVDDSVVLRNGSSVTAETSTTGQGGKIEIEAGDSVRLSGDSNISAQSTGSGNAGKIMIIADSVQLTDSSITTQSASSSFGGDVTIGAKEIVNLLDSEIVTRVAEGEGDGGNISVDPQFVVLNRSNVIAGADEGNGGDITLRANFFFISADSVVSAKSKLGIDGEINLEGPETDLTGGIATLSQKYLDASALLAGACAARTARAGSFVVRRRGALPAPPDAPLSPTIAALPAVAAAPLDCPAVEETP